MFTDDVTRAGSLDLALDSDFDKFFEEYLTQLNSSNAEEKQQQQCQQQQNLDQLQGNNVNSNSFSGPPPGQSVTSNVPVLYDNQMDLNASGFGSQKFGMFGGYLYTGAQRIFQFGQQNQQQQQQYLQLQQQQYSQLQQQQQQLQQQQQQQQQYLSQEQQLTSVNINNMFFSSNNEQQHQQQYLSQPIMQINSGIKRCQPDLLDSNNGIVQEGFLCQYLPHKQQQVNQQCQIEDQFPVEVVETGKTERVGSGGSSASHEQESVQVDKNKAVLEKNRRAQKKFRDKQKSRMHELEREVEKLNGEIQHLKKTNSQLLSQNDTLLTVLKLRDQKIQIMMSGQLQERETKEEQSINFKCKSKNLIVDDMSEQRNQEERYSNIQVKSIQGDEICQIWKESVMKVSELLVEAGGPNPPKAAITKLETEVRSVMGLCAKVAVLNPNCILYLLSTNMDPTIQEKSELGEEHKNVWQKILRSLHLSTEQKQALVEHFSNMKERCEEVRVERQVLNRELIPLLKQIYEREAHKGPFKIYSEARTSIQQLRENIERGHDSCTEYAVAFSEVLTPLQLAKAMVESYPYYPDMFQIGQLLLEEYQQNGGVFPEGEEFKRGCLVITTGVPP